MKLALTAMGKAQAATSAERPGRVSSTHDLTDYERTLDNAIRIYQHQQSHPRHHQMPLTPQ
jgi:hypothetical protein